MKLYVIYLTNSKISTKLIYQGFFITKALVINIINIGYNDF